MNVVGRTSGGRCGGNREGLFTPALPPSALRGMRAFGKVLLNLPGLTGP